MGRKSIGFARELDKKIQAIADEHASSFAAAVVYIVKDWFKLREEGLKVRVKSVSPPRLVSEDEIDLADPNKE